MRDVSNTLILLKEILISIQSTLTHMLELEDHKYEAIRNVDFFLLNQLNEKEEELIGVINLYEKKRQDTTDQLSTILGFDPVLTITEFMHKIPHEFQDAIRDCCLEIRKICDRISIATERNNYVLTSHSEIFGQILDLITDDHGISDQYNYFGTMRQSSESSLNLLDQIV
ncbi:MAG: flagellar export chaperone FlgN [Brevinema sp.]